MSAHPLPKTISVQRTLLRMPEDAPIETTVIKTLLEPGDDTTPPLYALLIKTTIGAPTPTPQPNHCDPVKGTHTTPHKHCILR